MKDKKNQIKNVSSKDKSSHPRFLIINIISFFLIFIFLQQITKHNPGYNWLFNKMIKDNYKSISKYKNLSFDQKMEIKMGFAYKFFKHINTNTPENAIIIFPPDSIFKINEKVKFPEFIKHIGWCNYFVYPRKLVSETDKDKTTLYSKATHVAIVNFWGYDKLEYNVKNKEQFSILPIKKP